MPNHAHHFERSFISINRILRRRSHFAVRDWILDSGAFTLINRYGDFPESTEHYIQHIKRWSQCGNLLAAVTQDYMCEPFVLRKTGKTVVEHQRLTIQRYAELVNQPLPTTIMPVLQGYAIHEYLSHIEQYGTLLSDNIWCGVGSICKRNANPRVIAELLDKIKQKRPDLRLHGFGLKKTALQHDFIRDLLYSADSMSWSFAARYELRNANDWREAKRFEQEILCQGNNHHNGWFN